MSSATEGGEEEEEGARTISWRAGLSSRWTVGFSGKKSQFCSLPGRGREAVVKGGKKTAEEGDPGARRAKERVGDTPALSPSLAS